MAAYTVEISDDAEQDLSYYRAYERRIILQGAITQLAFFSNRKPEMAAHTSNVVRLQVLPLASSARLKPAVSDRRFL